MKCHLQVKKIHSKTKNKDYLVTVLCLGNQEKFITLDRDSICLLLDIRSRELDELDNTFESKKYEFEA